MTRSLSPYLLTIATAKAAKAANKVVPLKEVHSMLIHDLSCTTRQHVIASKRAMKSYQLEIRILTVYSIEATCSLTQESYDLAIGDSGREARNMPERQFIENLFRKAKALLRFERGPPFQTW